MQFICCIFLYECFLIFGTGTDAEDKIDPKTPQKMCINTDFITKKNIAVRKYG